MSVGELVVRAYAWPCLLPGIIVDKDSTLIEFDGDVNGNYSYEETRLTILWSDGTISTEMPQELSYLEEMLSEAIET